MKWFAGVLLVLMSAGPASQPLPKPVLTGTYSPFAPGAELHLVASGFSFTEGATSTAAGDVYFVDQPKNQILLWHAETDKVEVWLTPSGYANGMSVDAAGNLVTCSDQVNQLWRISPEKKIEVLVSDLGGKLLNGPNDVWIAPNGNMYLTDPLYSRPWWGTAPSSRPWNDRNSQVGGRYVYLFNPATKALTPVETGFKQPNGLIGTPDGKTIYLSDINGGETYRYTIEADGTLSHKTLFCKTGSDGMTIDDEGNVYTTNGQGLRVFSKEGELVAEIRMNCANVCFGGKGKQTLFINTPNAVYTIPMRVHGVGPA